MTPQELQEKWHRGDLTQEDFKKLIEWGNERDKQLMAWLRIDLAAAVEWHTEQAGQKWHDPVNKAAEQGKLEMAQTVIRRLDAYEAGKPPLQLKGTRASPASSHATD